MKSVSEYEVAAGFLDSGRVLANAAHAAGAVAAIACLSRPHGLERLAIVASLLCWPVSCYFALRVAIDASLFRALAGDSEDGASHLDELLVRMRLRRRVVERSPMDRVNGALRLWRCQIVMLALQISPLILGLAMRLSVSGD